MAENPPPTDLFGLPLAEPKDPRGRKAHRRDVEVSKKVALSRAMGRTVEEIAGLIGLDAKTLRKYYSRELEQASELVQAILDEKIFEAAIIDKRVGAQRLLQERLERGKAAVPLAKGAAKTRSRPAPKTAPLGKKAQALVDAQTAHEGTSWGDILAPKPH